MDALLAASALVLCLALLLLIPLGIGGNVSIDGHGIRASWDEVTRVREANRTERMRIQEENETERWAVFWGVAPWLACIGGAVVVAVVWLLRRPGPGQAGRPPVTVLIAARPLLQRGAERRLEVIDGEWAVVDDEERAVYALPALEDGRRRG